MLPTLLPHISNENNECIEHGDLKMQNLQAKSHENYKAFWGLGRINFRTLKEIKKQPEAESTTDKPSPQ
jgi:hypothetical protein